MNLAIAFTEYGIVYRDSDPSDIVAMHLASGAKPKPATGAIPF